jgi:hypothetical protein
MSLFSNGFGGINLRETVIDLDKRVHELEAKLLHEEPKAEEPQAEHDAVQHEQ